MYIPIVGIDEVGRGPLAGPMFICGLSFKIQYSYKNIENLITIINQQNIIIKDSKKMTKTQRQNTYEWLIQNTIFYTSIITPIDIDKLGITTSIKKGILEILSFFKKINSTMAFFIDGNHNFDISHLHTIIKGDNKILEIASASIIAKVQRDTYMKHLSKKHLQYDWENNVGYGTNKHIEAIKIYGLNKHHRRTFCKKYLQIK